VIIPWSEIQSLKIAQRRGRFCFIQRIDGKTILPLSGFYSDEEVLLKTIIEKTNLHFVGMMGSYSDITYMGANSIG
jgi:hypothetical protein